MVLIESCSMSVFATELLVETLLSFSRRTICLCPLFPWVEHLAQGRIGRLVTTSFQGGNRGASERCLLHARERDRPCEGVGHDLYPALVLQEGGAGGDDLLDLGHQLGNGREPEADALEGRLPDICSGRVEGDPCDRPGCVRVPAGRALAAEKRQEREPVLPVTDSGRRGQRLLEPRIEVAAVRERAALDDAPVVEEVEEETRPRPSPFR